ncbi:MAG: ABC transporter permease [Candidatus Fimenecus sp.]
MVKNATAYVLRKKNRTFIVFIILTLVLSCLFSCLSVLKSSDNLEKSLYKSSNSSLALTRKDNQGYFETNEFKEINNIKEIEEVIPQYDGLAKLVSGNVVENGQKVNREDLSDDFKNIVSVQGSYNIKRNVLFNSGVFMMKEGRNIEKNDTDKIIVHSDFAEKNNLKLNDKVKLKFLNMNNNDDSNIKEYEFEIVGIFTGKKQERYTGLSSDLSENMMFVDYDSAQRALNIPKGKEIANKLTLFTDTPEKMDEAIKKVKELNADWSKYSLDKDANAFKEALESLNGIKHIIKIMTYSIMAAGAIVLSLILVLWLRERIYEIGILLSIGINKIKIIGQFILELIFTSLPALAASLIFGNLALKQMISGLVNSDENASVASSFLNTGFNAGSLVTFIQSYGILIIIITVSVIVASGMILIKKPKEILSKIS